MTVIWAVHFVDSWVTLVFLRRGKTEICQKTNAHDYPGGKLNGGESSKIEWQLAVVLLL